MKHWSLREQRWRDILLGSMLPLSLGQENAEAIPPCVKATGAFCERLSKVEAPLLFLGFRLAVWIVTLCPVLMMGRLRTFGGLNLSERDRLLSRLDRSRWFLIRQLLFVIKFMACLWRVRDAEPQGEPSHAGA